MQFRSLKLQFKNTIFYKYFNNLLKTTVKRTELCANLDNFKAKIVFLKKYLFPLKIKKYLFPLKKLNKYTRTHNLKIGFLSLNSEPKNKCL